MSLRTAVRNRILKDMLGSLPEAGWKILIVDKPALKIISSACKLQDIMARNVTVVENLHLGRQPFPQMNAVYLISPSAASVRLLVKDIDEKKYKRFHIFFTSKIDPHLLESVKASKHFGSIKTMMELNLDFLAVEKNVFHLNLNSDFKMIYKVPEFERNRYLEYIANKLYTFCVTIGEAPYIRYNKSKIPSSAKLAEILSKKLVRLSKIIKKEPKSILFILDRSIDPLAPALHEFTYQAMAYDLIEIKDGIYEHIPEGDENAKKKLVQLDDNDELWTQYRHKHIAEASPELKQSLKDFLNKNATFNTKELRNMEAENISQMISKLPQYQEKINLYSVHIYLQKRLMKIFKEQQLRSIALLEQDLAVGQDADGKPLKNKEVLSTLSRFLSIPVIPKEIKVRLIMIYLITQGGMADEKRYKLYDLAGLSEEDRAILSNLKYLGVNISSGTSIAGQISKFWQNLLKYTKSDSGMGFELSRYTCKVKQLCEELIQGKLSENDYPYIKKPPSHFKLSNLKGRKLSSPTTMNVSTSPSTSGTSMRSRTSNTSWNAMRQQKKKVEEQQTTDQTSEYKVFVFILGGATASETRSIYELENEYPIDFTIGSTSLLTPRIYLKKLRNLSSQYESDDEDDESI